MKYTTQINTITYINKEGTIIRLEKDSPMYNSLFHLNAPEDIYEKEYSEDITC